MANLEKSFAALENKLDRIEKMAEKTVARNYKKVLDDLRISISKLYEAYEIGGQLTWAEMSKYNRLQKLDKEVYDMIMDLYGENSKVIRGTLNGLVKDTYTNTISIVDGEVETKLRNVAKDLPVAEIVNEDMAGLTWTERMYKHRSDAIYDIQKEIKQGLRKGDTYSTMTKRLKNKMGADTYIINRIVRTEAHRVKAQAREESFERISKAGIKFNKKWLSADDERTRSSHQAMHKVIVGQDEEFTLPSEVKTKQPGLSGDPSEDINCRCVVILELEG